MVFGIEQEIELLKKELKIDPQNPQIFLKLATLHERLERWQEASTFWEQAYSLSRNQSSEYNETLQRWKRLRQLLDELEHPSASHRRSAADTLGCLQDARSLYKLVPLLTDLECQWNISQAIQSIHSPLSAKYLMPLLSHREHRVRAEVIRLFRHLELKNYFAEILGCLKDEHFIVLKETAITLGAFDNLEAVPELLKLMEHPNISVCHAAIEALVQLNPPRILHTLVKVVHSKPIETQLFILRTLEKLPAVPGADVIELFPFLKSPFEELREEASRLFSKSSVPEVFELVCLLLWHEEALIRLTAVQTLIRSKNPKALLPLQKLLISEKNPQLLSLAKKGIVEFLSN